MRVITFLLILLITTNIYAIEIGKQTSFKKPLDEQTSELNRLFDKLILAIQGRIAFGDGTITDGEDGENIDGQFQVFTSNAVADTEETITHTLGRTPIGYIVITQDKAASLYEGGTTWTSTAIYLKSSTASTTFTIFII